MYTDVVAINNNMMWVMRKTERDGCYPDDIIKQPINYWINCYMDIKNKVSLEEMSDKV